MRRPYKKGSLPLVGREEEIELLYRRWERAQEGEGQVVLVSGEAGIGKSRLLQVLREQIGQEKHWGIEAACSASHQNSVLYPVITQLQQFLQFGAEDTVHEKFHKLEQALTSVGMTSPEALVLLAGFLSLPVPEDYPPLNLSPQKQKEKTLEALVTWLQKESERQPVRLEVEDLHWADPSTLELLGLLIDQAPSFRVLVLLTFRPEFTPPWTMRAHMLPLTLGRLSSAQIAIMVQRVAGGKALSAEVLQQLTVKTDGVPLFVEELTKDVLESELLQATDERYELTGSPTSLSIPSSLADSLRARLDRLNTAKAVAQLGAVIGREFSFDVLQALWSASEVNLHEGLTQLEDSELIYRRGLPPEARYSFKHALIQDAAYESLLKTKRQQLHQHVAQYFESEMPEVVGTQPELLAHHYTSAGQAEQAIPYWQQAGQQAVERSANQEAIHHLTEALASLQTQPDTPAAHPADA